MLLQVSDLKVLTQFVRSEQFLLKGIGFCVQAGEPLAIIGESGSGKTMLALALMGLLPENCIPGGEALLEGLELISMKERVKNSIRGKELVYIPQSGAEFLNPALKIKSQIYESLKKTGVKGRAELKRSALDKLARVGLEDGGCILEKYPHQLSGGQAQRIALAISLCSDAKLVIADEPTKGIDANTAALVEHVLINDFSNACVIVITHDIDLACRCKNMLVLKDGEMQEYGSAADVLQSPESEYTKQLIAAMPSACDEVDYA